MDPRAPYQTIAAGLRHEIDRIKNSRFICDIRPVSDEAAVQAAIATARAEMPDARHHCWAYQLHAGERFKSSDDGEPGGSAGRPILAQINGRDLHDVVVIVTRYFGGTKLGVGGLIRAYASAAAKTLDLAEVITITPRRDLWIAYAYDDTTAVEAALRALEMTPSDIDYADRVVARLEVPDADWVRVRDVLIEHTAGRIGLTEDPP